MTIYQIAQADYRKYYFTWWRECWFEFIALALPLALAIAFVWRFW